MKNILMAAIFIGSLGQALAASQPYVITSVDTYWDGGTVSFAVTDSAGNQIEGFFAQTAGFSENSGKLYLGALHMDDSGARLATAAEDSAVLSVLVHALNLAYPEVAWQDESVLCSSSTCELITDSKSQLLLKALRAHSGCGLLCVNRVHERN